MIPLVCVECLVASDDGVVLGGGSETAGKWCEKGWGWQCGGKHKSHTFKVKKDTESDKMRKGGGGGMGRRVGENPSS